MVAFGFLHPCRRHRHHGLVPSTAAAVRGVSVLNSTPTHQGFFQGRGEDEDVGGTGERSGAVVGAVLHRFGVSIICISCRTRWARGAGGKCCGIFGGCATSGTPTRRVERSISLGSKYTTRSGGAGPVFTGRWAQLMIYSWSFSSRLCSLCHPLTSWLPQVQRASRQG